MARKRAMRIFGLKEKPIDDYNACKAQLGRGSGIDCCYVLHGSLMLDKNGNYIACILDGRDRVVKPRS